MTPLRIVLAVAVACALTAAAAPAVEHARSARAVSAGGTAAGHVRAAVLALTASTPTPPSAPAATRTVRVALPTSGLATAPAALLVGTAPGARDANATDVLAVRAGGRTRLLHLPVDLRVRTDPNAGVEPDGVGLRVRQRARLVLRYVRLDGRPTVVVTVRSGAEVYTPKRDHPDA